MLVTEYFAKDIYKGKTVFVTGGGSGINLGVAKNFAALGANIGICGRTQQKLDDAARELRALGAQVCPVGDPASPTHPLACHSGLTCQRPTDLFFKDRTA